ncbi:hypothetical protein JCM19233_5216 [Vibrio astriarenae]|nr:hypothetical protein JCM19233_5216 [Vibrio sp. C7]
MSNQLSVSPEQAVSGSGALLSLAQSSSLRKTAVSSCL